MTKKTETGQYGENLACNYLIANKYKIIDRNFSKPYGEIDIIAKYKDGTLVFVEVKTMTTYDTTNDEDALKPEDQLNPAKLKKVSKTALGYSNEHPELIRKSRGWRIDLIAIDLDKNKIPNIRHYENISLN
ncbi:hypothetical protein COV23_02275 [Candidatus Wolfebacteria bacterium CG10_big_fil_rev_8_21_14_0_10_31_9]|uniref:UPF0102 protein COV23_02275 n=1 Tax=Candidatus Wolfebacteria bacterium CG10_big_fil_rev_8_21_14_0_10_31_9 TaxID=1975070 RepID=A0A2H0RBW0_9BACT|nr:MAG: hypothetical protein COV23_02275 [Candidatus Wolfebacteria bacterium CG10_big_fil_rev_8_21_14_0_10_31_9]